MSTPTSVRSGVEFLGYRADAEIGRGGMGVVYRAQDLRLKRTVALKVIAPELALDERFRERFSRESELAMSLEHPNVVPIHDAGEFEGRLYLAMRHVEGSDLRRVLRAEGRLEPARAIAICRQVAEALDAAHAKGLVHRDVKPSNVLLDERGHVYLADFGLTRRLSEQGAAFGDARSLGTPAYLAPEQIEGGSVDGRADVYSLGCLLYECLTGGPPFSASSRLAVVWAHLEQAPPRASAATPQLSPAVDAVIRKAMAKTPEERYATCLDLVAAAEGALGLGRSAHRRRRTAAVVGALAAVAAVGAVLAVRGDGEAAAPAEGAGVPKNTLVRVDPVTNAVTRVVGVGGLPAATATWGDTVWVYNQDDASISEVDAATGSVRHTTVVEAVPADVDPLSGPVLAADAGGAWLVGFDFTTGRWLLTRTLPGGRGTREHRFAADAAAVVVADGATWVLLHRDGADSAVVRVDPRTGTVRHRLRVPPDTARGRVDGLGVGAGHAWVTESASGVLHRLELASGARRTLDLGELVTPPVVGMGSVWLSVSMPDTRILRIDPQTLRPTLSRPGLPAEEGRMAVGYDSLWRYDLPSGTLMRFDVRTGDPAKIIRVLDQPPLEWWSLNVTSLAVGAHGVWLTVGDDIRGA